MSLGEYFPTHQNLPICKDEGLKLQSFIEVDPAGVVTKRRMMSHSETISWIIGSNLSRRLDMSCCDILTCGTRKPKKEKEEWMTEFRIYKQNRECVINVKM